jgi:dTDP-4-dehydrorhamnose reductase
MRIAVIGANGQLGSEIVALGTAGGEHVLGFTHEEVEVGRAAGVLPVRAARPDIIINTAAMHDLNRCEAEPLAAWQVNAALPLVACARDIGAAYLYVSTDYVFDGDAGGYEENAATRPRSVYGRTKRAGEVAALTVVPRSGVCRVSYLFGKVGCRAKGGGNFVEFVVAALRAGRHLDLDADTRFSPTYAPDAAAQILRVAARVVQDGQRGVFHCTNLGCCSHHDWARAIAEEVGVTGDFAQRWGRSDALRPKRSDLVNKRLPRARSWREALRDYLKEMGHAD